jgi:hypothetical protein
VPVKYVGKAWSNNSRTWVYLDALLDCEQLQAKFKLEDCVKVHEHLGTHSGSERGLLCEIHSDGIMGVHPKSATNEKIIF